MIRNFQDLIDQEVKIWLVGGMKFEGRVEGVTHDFITLFEGKTNTYRLIVRGELSNIEVKKSERTNYEHNTQQTA